jgi:hypothetical protein
MYVVWMTRVGRFAGANARLNLAVAARFRIILAANLYVLAGFMFLLEGSQPP